MSARPVRCIRCNVWLVPFGQRDLGELVLEHLHSVHRSTDVHPCVADPRHPAYGWTPEPVA